MIEKYFSKIKKWCVKPLRNLLLCTAMLLVAAVTLLHIPAVQQQLLSRALNYLHKTTNYLIKCDQIRLTWLQHISLVGIEIIDPQENPLCTIHKCKSKINLLSLLFLKPDMIESVKITDAKLYLEENLDQDLNIALFYKKVILPFVPEEETDLSIQNIQLNGLNLYYHRQINLQNITVEHIHLTIKNFLSSPNHNSGNITSLSYKETSDIPFALKNCLTQFSIAPHRITLKGCQLITKYSHLQGDFELRHTKQLSLFADKKNIVLEATLKETTLSSIELNIFSDFFKGAHTLYKLNGAISLTPHSIVWENCKLVFGASDSYIEGTGHYNGIDRNGKTNILVKSGILHINDLHPYLKQGMSIDPYLTELQYIGLTNVTLMGNLQKAKLMGHITTNIGHIQTDLAIEDLDKHAKDVAYNGKITLHNVNIKAMLPLLPITSLSAEVAVKGKGSNVNSGTIDTVANITTIQTDTYGYQTIDASCTISNAIMAFNLNSKDPNAKLNITGSYHFGQKRSLNAYGIIEQIHLEKLGFMESSLEFSTQFSLNFDHILTKNPQGSLILHQCTIKELTKQIAIKQIAIHSVQDGVDHLLTLTSPLIDCKLKGTFTMDDLSHHIKQLITQLKNPAHKATIPTKLKVDYHINCKNTSPILNWFSNDLYIAPSTTLLGHFTYDKTYDFSLHLPTASAFCFKKISLEKAKIDLTIHDFTNHKNRLIQLNISSEKQDWYKKFETDHLLLQLLIEQNTFAISNKLSALKHNSNLSIEGSGTLMDHAIQIDLLPSSLTTKNKIWTIQTERSSVISKTETEIGNLSITSGNETLFIGGKLTESPTEPSLHCTIRNLALDYFSEVVEGALKGTLDANLVSHLRKGHLTTTGTVSLKECTIKGHPIGTFTTKAGWNILDNTLTLEGMLQKADQRLLQLQGHYYPAKQQNNLGITAIFNKMDLYLLNPFVASIFSEIEGKLTGKFDLTGSLDKPKLNGKGQIDKGQLKINYLNTLYQVTGKVKAKENVLYVDQLYLDDAQTGHATLSGNIAIQKGFPLVLSGRAQNLHLLNTRQEHNGDFYGSLYATGTLQIQGPILDLILKIQATANKGNFTIISHDKENIENTTKLVQFIYNKESKQPNTTALAIQNKDASAIKLILDLTILPTVDTKVIYGSYNSKDMVTGNGAGKIQLKVATDRKPYVMGNYIFEKGTCTVSVYNLIQKTFTITPNSQVTFNGYPQEGIADIKASYTQMASIAEFYPESNDKRPVPVEISLSAYGPLANPHVTYGIFFPVKSIDFQLNIALEECASKALLDKHYLSKQILSLLIVKKVYNEQEIDGWEALSNSINDFISQKIQDWVSKVDHNLDIEADLGIHQWKNEERNLLQETKIKVSYRLRAQDLKLSTTLGRRFNFINNWEISYQISKAHHMSAKLYQQPLQGDRLKSGLFGIGIAYTKKFG